MRLRWRSWRAHVARMLQPTRGRLLRSTLRSSASGQSRFFEPCTSIRPSALCAVGDQMASQKVHAAIVLDIHTVTTLSRGRIVARSGSGAGGLLWLSA